MKIYLLEILLLVSFILFGETTAIYFVNIIY